MYNLLLLFTYNHRYIVQKLTTIQSLHTKFKRMANLKNYRENSQVFVNAELFLIFSFDVNY